MDQVSQTNGCANATRSFKRPVGLAMKVATWITWGERERSPNSRFERLKSEGPRLCRRVCRGIRYRGDA